MAEQISEMYRPALETCLAKLREGLGGVDGVAISDNAFSVSVGYRGASEEEVALTRGCVDEALRELPMLRCVDGRNAYEIRPDAQRNVEAKHRSRSRKGSQQKSSAVLPRTAAPLRLMVW